MDNHLESRLLPSRQGTKAQPVFLPTPAAFPPLHQLRISTTTHRIWPSGGREQTERNPSIGCVNFRYSERILLYTVRYGQLFAPLRFPVILPLEGHRGQLSTPTCRTRSREDGIGALPICKYPTS